MFKASNLGLSAGKFSVIKHGVNKIAMSKKTSFFPFILKQENIWQVLMVVNF